jgi:hypothetical protein
LPSSTHLDRDVTSWTLPNNSLSDESCQSGFQNSWSISWHGRLSNSANSRANVVFPLPEVPITLMRSKRLICLKSIAHKKRYRSLPNDLRISCRRSSYRPHKSRLPLFGLCEGDRAELRPTSACRLHARVTPRRDDFTASALRPSHPAYLERCEFSLAAWRSSFSLWLPLRPFAHSFERLLSACWWPLLCPLSSISGLPAALKELHRAFMLLGGCPRVKRS